MAPRRWATMIQSLGNVKDREVREERVPNNWRFEMPASWKTGVKEPEWTLVRNFR